MGPTWGPPGSCRPQMGHMNLAIWVCIETAPISSTFPLCRHTKWLMLTCPVSILCYHLNSATKLQNITWLFHPSFGHGSHASPLWNYNSPSQPWYFLSRCPLSLPVNNNAPYSLPVPQYLFGSMGCLTIFDSFQYHIHGGLSLKNYLATIFYQFHQNIFHVTVYFEAMQNVCPAYLENMIQPGHSFAHGTLSWQNRSLIGSSISKKEKKIAGFQLSANVYEIETDETTRS